MQIIDHKANSYKGLFLSYIKTHGLKDGDHYSPLEYVRWLSQLNHDYEEHTGISHTAPYTPYQYECFLLFVDCAVGGVINEN